MKSGSKRQLIFEVQRVQTVRRRVETKAAFCSQCSEMADFADLSDLARTFEVSVAEAVLQLRKRGVHMQHQSNGNIVVCTGSLLDRSSECNPLLAKSLPPAANDRHLTSYSEQS